MNLRLFPRNKNASSNIDFPTQPIPALRNAGLASPESLEGI
jgi:hypothetical protein